MKSRWWILACGVWVLACSAHAQTNDVCGSRGTMQNLEVVGLTTDQRLVCIRERQGGQDRQIGRVTGLTGGEQLVGIDFRPANGMLYGLGDGGGVYLIDVQTGEATRQGTLQTDMGVAVPLSGMSFGVDFNPVPDRLRVISDAGQNLRVNVDNGTTIVDMPLNPAPGTGVTAAGYTNNDADAATNTVLYDINTAADQLTIQAPPNAGSLNPVGGLGVDVMATNGFDIFSVLRNNRVVGVRALAALSVAGQGQGGQGDGQGQTQTRLFRIDLTTGRAMPGRALNAQLVDLAIPLMQNGQQQGAGQGGQGQGQERGERD